MFFYVLYCTEINILIRVVQKRQNFILRHLFKKTVYSSHVYFLVLWFCFSEFTIWYFTEHLVEGALWMHKNKLDYFFWTGYLNSSWYLQEKLHLKTHLWISLQNSFSSRTLSVSWCVKTYSFFFCLITWFNFLLESPIPICDT